MASPVEAAEAFFHDRSVVQPALEAFAQHHGLTADDLTDAWDERSLGTGAGLSQDVIERANLFDEFSTLVDQLGSERMGEDYDNVEFIAGLSEGELVDMVKARLAAQAVATGL